MLSGSPPNSFPAAASRLGAGAEREGGGSSSGIRALVGVQLASSTSGDAETSLFPSLPGGDHCPVSHPKTSAGLPALSTTCRRRLGAVRCSEHSAGAWGRWRGVSTCPHRALWPASVAFSHPRSCRVLLSPQPLRDRQVLSFRLPSPARPGLEKPHLARGPNSLPASSSVL